MKKIILSLVATSLLKSASEARFESEYKNNRKKEDSFHNNTGKYKKNKRKR